MTARLISIICGILFAIPTCAFAAFSGKIISVTPSSFIGGQATEVTVRVQNTGDSVNVFIEWDSKPPNWSITPKYLNPNIATGNFYNATFTVTPPDESGNGIIVWKFYDDGFGIHPRGSTLLSTFNQDVMAVEVNTPSSAFFSPSTSRPQFIHAARVYSVSATYADPEGKDDLRFCKLRIDRPEGDDLTFEWQKDTGKFLISPESKQFATLISKSSQDVEVLADDSGFKITWRFFVNAFWPSISGGVRFGVFTEDDSGETDGWNYDNSNASFFIPKFGTTVITHGFQDGFFNEELPSWVENMAESIKHRFGNANIWKYINESGEFILNSGSGSGAENIVIFDWVEDSNERGTGYSEAAGEALFSGLIQGYHDGHFDLQRLHFIGHSRGTVINSEAIERLLALRKFSDWGNTIGVDQMTTLDPHDWGNVIIGGWEDFDVNIGGLRNTGIVRWKGIEWADNYWQDDQPLSETLNLTGRKLEGAYNVLLNPRDGSGIINAKVKKVSKKNNSKESDVEILVTHMEVHDWYESTIDFSISSPVSDSWFGPRNGWLPRTDDGFNMSALVGREREPEEDFDPPEPQVDLRLDGIINGDFARGDIDDFELSGWFAHGGRSPRSLIRVNGNRGMELKKSVSIGLFDQSPAHFARHNRFFIPPNARNIRLNYSVDQREEGTNQNVDRLYVWLLHPVENTFIKQIGPFPMNIVHSFNEWSQVSMNVEEFRNQVFRLTVGLLDHLNGTEFVNTEVWIDDIQFTGFDLDPFDGEPINGFAGWMASLWYGNYNADSWPWIFHGEHGWQFVYEGSTPEGIFIFDLGLNKWIFLNENTYRWIFMFGTDKGWIFTFGDNSPGRRFFQRADDQSIFSVP